VKARSRKETILSMAKPSRKWNMVKLERAGASPVGTIK
jgi:hypothetical protein